MRASLCATAVLALGLVHARAQAPVEGAQRTVAVGQAHAKRSESPSTLLEQLNRIHQQTVQTTDGKTITGLTENSKRPTSALLTVNGLMD